jgi:membrane dipeptidase
VLAIGTDFDGTTCTSEIKNIGEMEKLYYALKNNGFSETQVESIFYKNALRVIREVL